MNYQASNPKSLSETPERLSETKTRSGSPAAAAKKGAAAKKQAAEVLTSCTNPQLNCSICAASPGSEVIPSDGERFTHYQTLYQSLPELRSSERVIPKCCKLHDALLLRNRGGYGKPTAHAHVMMFEALPVGRTACRVRR